MPCNTLGRIPRLCGTENNFGTNDRGSGTKFGGEIRQKNINLSLKIPQHIADVGSGNRHVVGVVFEFEAVA